MKQNEQSNYVIRKLFVLLLVTVFALSISGCAREDNNDDMTDDNGTTENNGDLGFDMPNDMAPNNNDYATNDMGNEYLTSVRRINDQLTNTLSDNELTKGTSTDNDYLAKQGDYYNNTANAYKKALDDLNALDIPDDKSEYHNAITGYYQNGYDMYTTTGERYATFNTLDDERAYLDEAGDNYLKFDDNVRRAYEDALDALGFNRNERLGSTK